MLPLDIPVVEQRLEADLKKAISDHRAEILGLPATQWDEGLAFLLMPALASYETEAVTGQAAAGNDEFQQSIKRSTPAGSTFKGVPSITGGCGTVSRLSQDAVVRLTSWKLCESSTSTKIVTHCTLLDDCNRGVNMVLSTPVSYASPLHCH